MAIYKLVENKHPFLKLPLTGVSEDIDRKKLKDDLIESMEEHGGIGLSANQCGIMERVFVMYTDFKKREVACFFNPKITYESNEQDYMDEGCLSYPGLWLKIKRPIWIEVEYEDENGEQIKNKFKDLEARVFQHEYDHMEGTDFTKKVSRLRLDMAKKKANKKKKIADRIAEKLKM